MDEEVTLRHGTMDDVESALVLWRGGAVPSPTDNAEALRTLVAHPTSALIVAERSGVIVGTVIAGWDGWRGNIYRLAVAPSERRRGVASALLAAADAHLAAQGCVRISALVAHDDGRARAFWDSSAAAGYVHDALETRYVKMAQ